MSDKNTQIDTSVEHDSSQEHEIRLEKVKKLQELGIEPWPNMKQISDSCSQVIEKFKEEDGHNEVAIAGRIMAIREHGKTIFCTIQDRTGRLQVYIKKDILGEEKFEFFKHFIDTGDIVWFTGSVFKTKMGEITLKAQELTLLSKCLHPLPEKWHGLADQELKYRSRYLDLMSSDESQKKFKIRSNVVAFMRRFLDDHEFMEVETPMLHPIPGGAAAKPFVTHHNALHMDLYLRIAPELYMKRLVIGGFERVYEINRNFRNEGISTRHNPEFTMLELYMAHVDYQFMMNFIENMLHKLVQQVCGESVLPFGEYVLNFGKPFDRLSAKDAILKYSDIPKSALMDKTIDATLAKYNVKYGKQDSLNKKIFALFEEVAESKLIQPTYIIDFPIEISPLSKRSKDNPSIAARFELFIAGMEISNGFSELNDPFDQAERFKHQVAAQQAGDEEAHQYDADYIHALEYGLPPTCGVGIGIDRLTMLLTNTTSIKDVILFPTLKKKESTTFH